MSPAEKAAREEMADRKMDKATEKAYSKSLTNTEYTDQIGMPKDQIGMPKDQIGMPKKDPRDAVRGQRGYAKGGSVGSASKRADGIAQRGKTRGTMVMCGGGMAKGYK
jgi:hypothetical protein